MVRRELRGLRTSPDGRYAAGSSVGRRLRAWRANSLSPNVVRRTNSTGPAGSRERAVSLDSRGAEFDPSRQARSCIAMIVLAGGRFATHWRLAKIMRARVGLCNWTVTSVNPAAGTLADAPPRPRNPPQPPAAWPCRGAGRANLAPRLGRPAPRVDFLVSKIRVRAARPRDRPLPCRATRRPLDTSGRQEVVRS
jgi:hypothetical protein